MATTSSNSPAAATARRIESPCIPTVAIRVTPAARARSTRSASGGSHESRWQWVSTMALGPAAYAAEGSGASTFGKS